METCPSAHHWARGLTAHGHRVRLIAPHYVKPFINRRKNDAADAEAIAEAATRPAMRFVEPKTEEPRARAVAFRAREQIVKQRTEAINVLRAHLCEFEQVPSHGSFGKTRRWASSGVAAMSPHGSACRPSLGRIAFRPALPRQHSYGGGQRRGKTSKMGQRDIRRL